MSTKFFTNAEENTLLKKLAGIFQHMQVYHFDALVGYFRASGYFRIQEHLRTVEKVRILVGIDVDMLTFKANQQGLAFHADGTTTVDKAIERLRIDIQKAEYNKEIEAGMLQFIKDIMEQKVELRAHPSKNLHAKVYIFRQQHEHEHAGWGSVITGSSNLTEAGMESNFEFNVELRDHDDVKFALETFEKLWAEGVEITPPKVEAVKKETFLNDDFTPYEVYIKFLIEYFGKSIEYDPDDDKDMPTGYMPLRYQKDAVDQGYDKLRKFGGFFLADVVGLGKTVVATMIAKKFANHNGIRTSVLVVHPPALKKGWELTLNDFNLRFPVRLISSGSLHKVEHPENYDLIIVDEAHKFRTDTSDMFNNLQTLCKTPRRNPGPDGDNRKKVMLISATPLNNRPEDILNLVTLFQDARNSTLDSVPNLAHWFRPHIDLFNKMRKEVDRAHALKTIKRIYEEIRRKIIEPLTIRRTRTDLLKNDEYKKDIEKQGLKFPEIHPPQPIYYQLDEELNALFDDTIQQIRGTNHSGLGYYRYQAIKYLVGPLKKNYDHADTVSERLANIMRIQLVKRLDSSFFAFIESLKRYRDANRAMVTMFERGRIHVAPSLGVSSYITEEREDELIVLMDRLKDTDPTIQTYGPDDFIYGFEVGLKKDQTILDDLYKRWEHWRDHHKDPKLVELIDRLRGNLLHPGKGRTNKLIVFSEFKDTTNYIKRELESAGFERMLAVDSHNVDDKAETIRLNFDARVPSNEQKDDLDLLITTEVLAEGVNLHRSHTVLNYDVPWNSTRLMQRIGRVNRIGTPHSHIFVYNFYPCEQTEGQIELYKKAVLKLQAFHTALGEDSQIYSSEEEYGTFGLFEKVTKDEDRDNRITLLLDLRRFRKEHPEWYKRISSMPLRSRVGRKASHAAKTTAAYLKNPRRDGFYKVGPDNSVEEITFLDCAELLRATSDEQGIAMPAHHHDQVGAAIAQYKLEQVREKQSERSIVGFGPNERKAISMLDAVQRLDLVDNEERELIRHGLDALKRGKFQHLQRDLNALRRAVTKTPMKPNVITAKTLQILKKYPLNGNGSQVAEEPLAGTEPDIIITETFA